MFEFSNLWNFFVKKKKKNYETSWNWSAFSYSEKFKIEYSLLK